MRVAAYYTLLMIACVFWLFFVLCATIGVVGAVHTARSGTAMAALKVLGVCMAWSAAGGLPAWAITRAAGRIPRAPRAEPRGFDILPPR